MATIGKIKVDLQGDTRHFDQSMRRSARRVQTFKTQLGALRNAILPLTGALGFGALIRSTVREADQMGNLSRRLGVSVDSFSRLARVLNRSGIGMAQSATMLQRLQRRAADAQDGNKQLSSAFRQLGIDVNRFVRLDPVSAFLEVGEALAKVTPQAEKIQLAFKLLDSEGVQVLQTNLPKLREEMAATSAISDEQAKKIKALADAWERLGERMRSATAQGFAAMTGTPRAGAQAGLIDKGLKRALDPAQGIRESVMRWIRGVLGLDAAPGLELQAPRTGRIQGAPVRGSRRISVGPQSDIAAADARAGLLHGGGFGSLGPSDAIIEQLRAIRRNTEKGVGAVLE